MRFQPAAIDASQQRAEIGRTGGISSGGSNHTWLLSTLLVAAPLSSQAHHSFAAVFDASAPVAVTGAITRVEWQNPHIWFYLAVESSAGDVTEWGFSGAPPGVLMRRGISKDVLQIGTVVHVEGFRARDGSNNASGGRVTLPDGRNVFTASSEDAVPESSAR